VGVGEKPRNVDRRTALGNRRRKKKNWRCRSGKKGEKTGKMTLRLDAGRPDKPTKIRKPQEEYTPKAKTSILSGLRTWKRG